MATSTPPTSESTLLGGLVFVIGGLQVISTGEFTHFVRGTIAGNEVVFGGMLMLVLGGWMLVQYYIRSQLCPAGKTRFVVLVGWCLCCFAILGFSFRAPVVRISLMSSVFVSAHLFHSWNITQRKG